MAIHLTHMVLTVVGFDGPSVSDFDPPFATTLVIVLAVLAVVAIATWLVVRGIRAKKR